LQAGETDNRRCAETMVVLQSLKEISPLVLISPYQGKKYESERGIERGAARHEDGHDIKSLGIHCFGGLSGQVSLGCGGGTGRTGEIPRMGKLRDSGTKAKRNPFFVRQRSERGRRPKRRKKRCRESNEIKDTARRANARSLPPRRDGPKRASVGVHAQAETTEGIR